MLKLKLRDRASAAIWKMGLVFFALACLEAGWSFVVPSYEENASHWIKPSEAELYRSLTTGQQYSYKASDRQLLGKVLWLISDYRMNTDVGGFVLMAHDFPAHYFSGHLGLLTRPLYPLSVHLLASPLRLWSDSYSVTFAAGVFLNILLYSLTALLLYILVREYLSARVALLSSLLFIFSPLGHVWLIQPGTDVYGAFFLMTGLYLLNDYSKQPTVTGLVIFSFVIGLLLLGKKMFAVTFFVMLIGLWAGRYRESGAFLVLHLVPYGLWYLWVTQVWHLPFYDDQISDHWRIGTWLLTVPRWPWHQVVQKVLAAIPSFIDTVLYGFLVIPVLFAAVGLAAVQVKRKWLLVGGITVSFFALFFIADLYIPRLGFLLFPIVYPAAVVGIETTAEFLKARIAVPSAASRFAAYAVIVLLSNINVYYFVSYG